MTCPKCGRQMPQGAPHGPGTSQYECRSCNVFIPCRAAKIEEGE